MRRVGFQSQEERTLDGAHPAARAGLHSVPAAGIPWSPPPRGTPVLVLPMSSRSGVNAARSLTAAGYRVVTAHITPSISLRTRHAALALRCPSPTRDPGGFARWVEDTCAREGVRAVLPLDEESVKALLDSPAGGAAVSGPTAAQYSRLGDKGGLAATARAVGVNHPDSVVVDQHGPQGDWPRLPSVIKPILSEPGSLGGEIVVVHTPAERDRAIARIVGALGGVMVQELIVGQGWRVHFVRGEAGFAAVCGRTLRRWPPNTGMSSTTAFDSVHIPALNGAARILDSVNYRGSGSVQFIEHAGRMHVHDVNLRPETSIGGAMAAGLDLPRLAVEVALGRATLGPVRPRTVRYVWLSAEVRALALALGGRQEVGRPGAIARDIAYAALHPRGVLDPFDGRDPLPFVGALGEVGRWALRPVRRRPS